MRDQGRFSHFRDIAINRWGPALSSKSRSGIVAHRLASQPPAARVLVEDRSGVRRPDGSPFCLSPPQPPFPTSPSAPTTAKFFQISKASLLFPPSRSLNKSSLPDVPSLPLVNYSLFFPFPISSPRQILDSASLMFFLPGYTVTLHFPPPLPVRGSTELWPVVAMTYDTTGP